MSNNSLADPGQQGKPEKTEKPAVAKPTAVASAPKAALAEPVAPPEPKADPSGVDGRKRVIIEGVTPEIDGGRFADQAHRGRDRGGRGRCVYRRP